MSDAQKVYAVTSGDYSSYSILKVFLSEELAELYRDRYNAVDPDDDDGGCGSAAVEVWEAETSVAEVVHPWEATMHGDGTATIRQVARWADPEDSGQPPVTYDERDSWINNKGPVYGWGLTVRGYDKRAVMARLQEIAAEGGVSCANPVLTQEQP